KGHHDEHHALAACGDHQHLRQRCSLPRLVPLANGGIPCPGPRTLLRLACLQEPLVELVARRTRAARPTAVAITLLSIVCALVLAGVIAAPTLQRELASSVTSLPAQLDAASQEAVVLQGGVNGRLNQQGMPFQVDLASKPALDSATQQLPGAS